MIAGLIVPDRTNLAYSLHRPAREGRFPVLLLYDAYSAGGVDAGPDETEYMRQGYAVLGVSARGTGCSQGVFRDALDPQQALDGARVIEWAGSQPWSNGNVGMYGNSNAGVISSSWRCDFHLAESRVG